MRISARLKSPLRVDGLAPPDILVRRFAILLYSVGIITSQVAAHVGALPVDNIRLFEFLGLVALGATTLTWQLTEKHFNTAILVMTSLTGTVLVACAVALSGGSDSPLWVYYLFPLIFNAFFFQNEITWVLLPIIILVSMLPALVEPNYDQLMIQLFIIAPMYVALTFCSQILVRGLRGASTLQVIAADTQARLNEVQRWNGQVETLHLVTQQISRLTSVDDIANAIIEHTRRVIPYDSARVYLRDGERLLPVAFHGSPEYAFQSLETLWLNMGEGLTGWAAKHATSLNIDDVRGDERTVLVPEDTVPVESMLLSPLIHEDMVIGVLVLVRVGRSQFSDQDSQLLDILAGQAASAVSKGWSLDEAHLQARTDGLTGLLNHRAVTEQLAAQLDLAETYQYPLSIAMLDADKFKRINDSHGHLAGNAVLQKMAALLETYCRSGDLAARYGGDEFMLILPHTGTDNAERITRRIIDQISAHKVFLSSDDPHGVSVCLSCGVATFPDDGSTPEELHRVADARLYATKSVSHQLVGTGGQLPHRSSLPDA